MDAWIVVIVGFQLAFLGFIVWLAVHYRSRRQERLAEERLRLIERFESPEAFAAFLESENGKEVMRSWQPPSFNAKLGWALGVYIGVVLLFVGGGFATLAVMNIWNDREIFTIPAVLSLACGLGILVGARLCRGALRPPAGSP